MELNNKVKEIPIKTSLNFCFLPKEIVSLERDIEISLQPTLNKKVILPAGMEVKIDKCIPSETMMTYQVQMILREMIRCFKELSSDEKNVLDDTVEIIEFHDCDFKRKSETLYNISSDKEGNIEITWVR